MTTSDFISRYKVEPPLKILFTRFKEDKKIKFNNYNMSGLVPKIQIETENSSRPTIQIKNPTNVKGIDIIRDDDSASDASGSTIEPSVPDKKSNIKHGKSKNKFNVSVPLKHLHGRTVVFF